MIFLPRELINNSYSNNTKIIILNYNNNNNNNNNNLLRGRRLWGCSVTMVTTVQFALLPW